jgi:hypothetical protein
MRVVMREDGQFVIEIIADECSTTFLYNTPRNTE